MANAKIDGEDALCHTLEPHELRGTPATRLLWIRGHSTTGWMYGGTPRRTPATGYTTVTGKGSGEMLSVRGFQRGWARV